MANNGAPKAGVSFKKILDKDGAIVGYLKGKNVYDVNLRIWGTVPSKKVTSQYIDNANSGVVGRSLGFFDANNNLFSANGTFIGSVKRGAKLTVAIPLTVFLILLMAVSVYFSTFIMGKIGIDSFSPEYPVFELSQPDGNGGSKPWNQLERLDILNSTAGSQVIIPGAIGNYSFVMDNKNDSNITIDFVITDINEKSIPMRYRLKMSNIYIVGNEKKWGTIASMDVRNITIPQGSKVVFTLEWMWDTTVSDTNDTNIGNDFTSSYSMNLKIDAQLSKK